FYVPGALSPTSPPPPRSFLPPSSLATPSWRLGFDIGGTFTDFVLQDVATGAVFVGKELTTPRDPSEGVMRGLAALLDAARVRLAEVEQIVHGTTLGANLVIERRGARTFLVTTRRLPALRVLAGPAPLRPGLSLPRHAPAVDSARPGRGGDGARAGRRGRPRAAGRRGGARRARGVPSGRGGGGRRGLPACLRQSPPREGAPEAGLRNPSSRPRGSL